MVMTAWHYKYTETTELHIYFKWLNFKVHKLYVNKNITKEVTGSRCFNLGLSNEATVSSPHLPFQWRNLSYEGFKPHLRLRGKNFLASSVPQVSSSSFNTIVGKEQTPKQLHGSSIARPPRNWEYKAREETYYRENNIKIF